MKITTIQKVEFHRRFVWDGTSFTRISEIKKFTEQISKKGLGMPPNGNFTYRIFEMI